MMSITYVAPKLSCLHEYVRLSPESVSRQKKRFMMINSILITILIFDGVHSMKDGRRVDAGEFPYVVSIQLYIDHLCSGTIIDEYHILTAGHPVQPYNSSDLLVVTGLVMISYPWITSSLVANIFLHPDFEIILFPEFPNDPSWENDIALLRLNAPLDWTPTVAPVSLSTIETDLYHCFECIISSWNRFEENGVERVILMWDIVYMVEIFVCNQWGIYVLQNQHCFTDLFGTIFITSEDIGSPIICGDSMVGFIAKEGKNGITASPSTFLSTLRYAEFITDHVKDGEFAVRKGDYPYVASLWTQGKYLCGGIIVNNFQVITAGHCVRSSRGIYKPRSIMIAAGSIELWYFDGDEKWFAVKEIAIHPLFKGGIHPNNPTWYIDHNLALIKISAGFVWSPTIQSFPLPVEDDFSNQQSCQLLHWKNIENFANKRDKRKLMKSNVILVDPNTPNLQLRRFQFAAKSPHSIQVANAADMGNPIICRGYPLGFLIEVDLANEITPMIFLKIRPYVHINQ